jgi:hypothetical protein
MTTKENNAMRKSGSVKLYKAFYEIEQQNSAQLPFD